MALSQLSSILLYVYTIFIHSSVVGQLGCFHILAIVNSATTKIGMHVSFWIIVLSRYMPRNGIAGSYGIQFLLFWANPILLSMVAAVPISVQFSHSVVSDSLWPHGLQHARLPWPSPTLLKLISLESVMPPNHLILCCPLLPLPLIISSIRVFSSESVLRIRWPKYWSFSFSISPSNEYSGLISFRFD